MSFEFKLPDVGEGIAEGEIVSWLVKAGDVVQEDHPLVEIMTDKATVEITSPRAGTIQKLVGAEGEVVKVGAPLVVFGNGAAPAAGATPPPAADRAPAPARQDAAAPTPTASAPEPKATAGRVLAAPATRRLARERGVDIAQVRGSGPNGRVTPDDVARATEGGPPAGRDAAAAAPSPAPPTAIAAGAAEERIPVRGVRKAIAQHMAAARDHVTPFTYVDEVEVSELVKLREELKPLVQEQGVKLTYLPFIIKAVVAGLRKHPTLNGAFDESSQEIVVKRQYNIGLATATDAGLIVPVLKGADRRSMVEIGAELARLSGAAREGKITPEELQGGTFTITSLGALGGLFATPVINYPELAIMGVHEIKKRPVVHNDQVVIRDVMLISLTFDHRIIDGHVGAAFAQEVKRLLERPKRLLVEAV